MMTIDDNPPPPPQYRDGTRMAALVALEPPQAMFEEARPGADVKRQAESIRAQLGQLKRRYPERQFTTRVMRLNGRLGVRIWRLK